MGTVVWDVNVPITRTERVRRAGDFARTLVVFYAYLAAGLAAGRRLR